MGTEPNFTKFARGEFDTEEATSGVSEGALLRSFAPINRSSGSNFAEGKIW